MLKDNFCIVTYLDFELEKDWITFFKEDNYSYSTDLKHMNGFIINENTVLTVCDFYRNEIPSYVSHNKNNYIVDSFYISTDKKFIFLRISEQFEGFTSIEDIKFSKEVNLLDCIYIDYFYKHETYFSKGYICNNNHLILERNSFCISNQLPSESQGALVLNKNKEVLGMIFSVIFLKNQEDDWAEGFPFLNIVKNVDSLNKAIEECFNTDAFIKAIVRKVKLEGELNGYIFDKEAIYFLTKEKTEEEYLFLKTKVNNVLMENSYSINDIFDKFRGKNIKLYKINLTNKRFSIKEKINKTFVIGGEFNE